MPTNNHSARQFGPTPLHEVTGNPYEYTNYLERLRAAYNRLDVGDFTDTVLAEILTTGTEGVLIKYKVEVEQEIEAAGIKSKRLQEILTKGYYEMLGELSAAVADLIQAVDHKREWVMSEPVIKC